MFWLWAQTWWTVQCWQEWQCYAELKSIRISQINSLMMATCAGGAEHYVLKLTCFTCSKLSLLKSYRTPRYTASLWCKFKKASKHNLARSGCMWTVFKKRGVVVPVTCFVKMGSTCSGTVEKFDVLIACMFLRMTSSHCCPILFSVMWYQSPLCKHWPSFICGNVLFYFELPSGPVRQVVWGPLVFLCDVFLCVFLCVLYVFYLDLKPGQ